MEDAATEAENADAGAAAKKEEAETETAVEK